MRQPVLFTCGICLCESLEICISSDDDLLFKCTDEDCDGYALIDGVDVAEFALELKAEFSRQIDLVVEAQKERAKKMTEGV